MRELTLRVPNLNGLVEELSRHPNPNSVDMKRNITYTGRNPFAPAWKVYGQHENQTYTVQNVIALNTSGLHGQLVKRSHYGGPLALLRLLQFTKRVVEEQTVGARSV